MTELLRAVLEDLAGALDEWTASTVEAVADPAAEIPWADEETPYRRLSEVIRGSAVDDFRKVLNEALRGVLHSALAVVDGATASAEIGRVRLVDERGEPLGEGLHELFVAHLIETDRLA